MHILPWRIGFRHEPCGSCRFPLGSRSSIAAWRSPAEFLLDIATLPGSRLRFRCPKAAAPPDGSESGSGTGFRPASRFFLARPAFTSTAFILADVRRLGVGSGLKLSTVAGRPPLATRRNCHPSPSRTNENRLWIRCITGISIPPDDTSKVALSFRSRRPCPRAAPGTIL
jgi:hypothetical protein